MSQQPKIIIPTSSIKNVEVEYSKEMQSAADCKGMGIRGINVLVSATIQIN